MSIEISKPKDRSLKQVVGDLSADASLLVRQEIARAKAELKEKVIAVAKRAALFGAAGLLMTVTIRTRVPTGYGWSASGKTAAEISADIRQTRYRLEADARALRSKVAPRRLVPVAALGAGLAVLTLLIRKIRGRRR